MQNNVLAYMGAIIDGEGCIYISKSIKKNKFSLRLQISVANTSKELIDFIFQNFGGNIYDRKSKQINNQDYWVWYISKNKEVINFLEKITPYLLIKREQSILALEFAKSRLNILKKPRDKRFYTKRQIEIYEEVRRLKKEHPKDLPKYNFTEEEKLYYFAGLIDGEGSIRITKAVHKNMYGNKKLILVPQISIGNTDKRLMYFLKKEFPEGFFIERKRKEEWKNLYEWFLQGNNKEESYKRLVGKLIEKEERLKLLLKYIESRKVNYKRTEEEIKIFLEMRKLNLKGKEEYDINELKEHTKLIRSPRKLFVKKEELDDLYWNKKLSIRQIAKIYRVSFDTIRLRLIKEGIKIRNHVEGKKLNPGILTEQGRLKLSKASSKHKKEQWKDKEYREKMEKNLEIARNLKILKNPLKVTKKINSFIIN